MRTLRWVLMWQGFSHFSVFLPHFVLAKSATSSTRVKLRFRKLMIILGPMQDVWDNAPLYLFQFLWPERREKVHLPVCAFLLSAVLVVLSDPSGTWGVCRPRSSGYSQPPWPGAASSWQLQAEKLHSQILGTIYGFSLECWNIRFTPRPCLRAFVKLQICAFKHSYYYIYYYIDIYLNDVIFALSWGVQKLKMPVENTSYTVFILNPTNAEATFIQSTRTQRFLKII